MEATEVDVRTTEGFGVHLESISSRMRTPKKGRTITADVLLPCLMVYWAK